MIYMIRHKGVDHPSGQPCRGPSESTSKGTLLTVSGDCTKTFGPKMRDKRYSLLPKT